MSSRHSLTVRLSSALTAVLLAVSGFAASSPSVVRAFVGPCGTTGTFGSSGPISSCTYTTGGLADQFNVPVGVTALYIEAVGGVGGSACGGASGGIGSSVAATYSGAFSTLNVAVGGAGSPGGHGSCVLDPLGGFGGEIGGGNGGSAALPGGGGGGASFVGTDSITPANVTSLLIVAAGGGGGGGGSAGSGGAGDKDGNDGGASTTEDGQGGTAGTPAAVGLGGSAGSGAFGGANGGVMSGGTGGGSSDYGGGGGGGGYNGGGGGGSAVAGGRGGGGGGGASFFAASAMGTVGPIQFAVGGMVKISWGFNACVPGHYSANGYDYPGPCAPAEKGHYVDHPAADHATPCPVGFFAANTGQTQCDPATKGHYVNQPASEHDTPCALGFYQPNIGATACLAAGIGYYVDTTGASAETPCPAGKTTPSTGSDSASDCVPLTPYQVKQNASAHLKALMPTGSAAADQLLTRATSKIDKSLAAWRWVGQDALTPLHGWAVFNSERKAVGLLTDPLFSGNATVSQAIHDLLAADRAIVVKAINDDPDATERASANAQLARADGFIVASRYSKAIHALRQAWLMVV